jgi:HAD superfamily hydrolase (TIGR01484 family)
MTFLAPIEHLDRARLRRVEGVLTDIDDTLTTGGRLTPMAYAALGQLHDAGLRVIPITGRPAGWCDHIARMWPVSAVVGENGAFYFMKDVARGTLVKRYALDSEIQRANRARLEEIREVILEQVPGAGIASDQDYRIADLAVDFCEDVTPLTMDEVAQIVEIAESFGATAKVSSIHVNIWFGDFDKLTMTRRLCAEVFGESDDDMRERYLFLGDSPNDSPMFGFFPLSIGVANVREFLGRMSHPPRFITDRSCGEGFAELASHLLTVRESTGTTDG